MEEKRRERMRRGGGGVGARGARESESQSGRGPDLETKRTTICQWSGESGAGVCETARRRSERRVVEGRGRKKNKREKRENVWFGTGGGSGRRQMSEAGQTEQIEREQ